MHDGWYSVDHNVLGVSVQFVDMPSANLITVALGLQRAESGKAKESAIQIERILARYVIDC